MKKVNKFLKKTHKRTKKRVKFLRKHPLLIPVSTFVVMVLFGLVLFINIGATTVGASDKKIVDVYIDGEGRTITTRAGTVGELLERLEVPLISEDVVEPAKDSVILEDNTQVNVYRARPVEVEVGGRVITLLTAQRAPRLVAIEAGIKLFPEDNAYFAGPGNITPSSSFGEKLVVDRATPIQLNVYGVASTQRTTAKTIREFIERNGINIIDGATVQPDNLDSLVVANMLIAVNNIGIKTVSVNEVVDFAVESREDAALQVGESRVEREGENGERSVIYEIQEVDGVETSRVEIQAIVTKDPVSKIVIKGKKPATLSSSVNVSAEKVELMLAAGISSVDHPYVDFIVAHESGWRPGAANGSGAYGLCQALPASKMASAGGDYLTNPVTQLRWCSGYASGRYGGWQGAYNAWLAQRWW